MPIKLPAGWRLPSDVRRAKKNHRGLDGKTNLEAAWHNLLWQWNFDAFNTCKYEFEFHPERKWRFDCCWPAQKIAVELDGGQYMSKGGRHARDEDREKLNAAAEFGWRVFHYTKEMLEADGAGCVAQVIRALEKA